MGRLMGLDYGSKTIGVALSDPLQLIASPLDTIVRDRENKLRPSLRRIVLLAQEQEVERIIVGYPLNMDGSRGERAVMAESFAELLRGKLSALPGEKGIEVTLWDERLSTVGADEILDETGVRREDRKSVIDKVAAALILEDYMKNGRI